MQNTHDTNGPGLPPFPNHVEVKTVNVYMHDSGMIATHDYSCPCCRKFHAILKLDTGIMSPCATCTNLGYKIIKSKTTTIISKIKSILKLSTRIK